MSLNFWMFGDFLSSPSVNISTMWLVPSPQNWVLVSWGTNSHLRCLATAASAADRCNRWSRKVPQSVWCARVSVCSRSDAVRGVLEDRIQRREPSVLVGLRRLQEDVQRNTNGGRRQKDLRRVCAGRRPQTGEAFITFTLNLPSCRATSSLYFFKFNTSTL